MAYVCTFSTLFSLFVQIHFHFIVVCPFHLFHSIPFHSPPPPPPPPPPQRDHYEKVYFITPVFFNCGCAREASVICQPQQMVWKFNAHCCFMIQYRANTYCRLKAYVPVESTATELEVTCKVGATEYKSTFWVYQIM